MPKIILALFLFAVQAILAPDARTTSFKANMPDEIRVDQNRSACISLVALDQSI